MYRAINIIVADNANIKAAVAKKKMMIVDKISLARRDSFSTRDNFMEAALILAYSLRLSVRFLKVSSILINSLLFFE